MELIKMESWYILILTMMEIASMSTQGQIYCFRNSKKGITKDVVKNKSDSKRTC